MSFQLEVYIDQVDAEILAELKECPALLPGVGDELNIEEFMGIPEGIECVHLIVYRRRFWVNSGRVYSVTLWARKLDEQCE